MKKLILTKDKFNSERIMMEAINVLKKGGIVIAPTDTVYGLLVDSQNKHAVRKLIKFKERPAGNPISVFVPEFKSIEKYIEISDKKLNLIKKILPGPFTIVLKSKHKVNHLLESEDMTLGIRLPKYEFIMDLVKAYGIPVTATSANLSGKSPLYSLDGFLKNLSDVKKNLIDLVIDAGKLALNKPSTVIDLTEDKVKVLRQGDLFVQNQTTIISGCPEETKKIAVGILKDNRASLKEKPLIIILEGELGAGKTIFVKGIGEYLGVKNIVSPTFVIYYEYEIKKSKVKSQKSKLVHIDLYNVKNDAEFEHLGLKKYLKPGNILCFEWGEKAGEIIPELEKKSKVVYVKIGYIDDKERRITWNVIS